MQSEARSGDSPNMEQLGLEELELLVHAGVAEIARRRHADNLPASHADRPRTNPEDPIPYSGRVFGPEEVVAATRSTIDFWLTLGEQGELFERELARTLG
ncbi:MAG: hypothetical protein RLZZ163_1420, partial [Actinomycetota bacterium]